MHTFPEQLMTNDNLAPQNIDEAIIKELKKKIPQGKCATDLDVLAELVVADDVDGGELPDPVELELDLDGLAVARVVAPADPALAALVRVRPELEVVRPGPAVGQQAQATAQLAVPGPVVGRVEEFPVAAALVALRHRVRDHAVCGPDERQGCFFEIRFWYLGFLGFWGLLFSFCWNEPRSSLRLFSFFTDVPHNQFFTFIGSLRQEQKNC